MSFGEGEYYEEWWEKTPESKYICANCECQIYYPYKWRNVDKSQVFTKDWKIIESKIYIQINEKGKHIRLCDCCDKLFTTEQLIKLFLTNGIGAKRREKEKEKKWNKREEKKRQKKVSAFGEKLKIHKLCPDCGGEGFIENSDEIEEDCNNCLGGKIIELISLEELIIMIKK